MSANRMKAQSIECSNLLREAVLAGDVEAVRTLLGQNLSINQSTESPLTCLWEAVRMKNFEIAELLIKSGADVNQRLGAIEGYRRPSSILLELAVWSEQRNATRLAKLLVDQGADLNVRGGFMMDSVLNLALRFGNLLFAEMLLASGARTVGVKKSNLPALIAAALSPKPAGAIRLVIDKAREKDTAISKRKSFFNGNALHCLGENCVESPEAAKILLKNGISLTDYDEFGYTPFHRAVDRSKKKLAALYLERGVNVDQKTTTGLTPIYLAASKCDIAMLEFLLSKNADITVIVLHSDPIIMPAGFCSSPAVSCDHDAIVKRYKSFLENFEDPFNWTLDKILVDELKQDQNQQLAKADEVFDISSYFAKINRSSVAVTMQPMNKIVLKELAKLEFEKMRHQMPDQRRITLSQKYSEAIGRSEANVAFFNDALAELSKMEVTVFYGNFSYYYVLKSLKNRRLLAGYTENIGFVSGFNQYDYIDMFKIFGPDLDFIFADALKKRDLVQRIHPMFNKYLPKEMLYRVSQFVRISKTYGR